MHRNEYDELIANQLAQAVTDSKQLNEGAVADYIPELANIDPELTAGCVQSCDGKLLYAGDSMHRFTLQSVAKVIVLIGLMEEYGEDKIFSWIHAEPTGTAFASVAQVDRYGPVPANPMVNAGAIALCSRIPGDGQARADWLDMWSARLFGASLSVSGKTMASERLTSDRNRAIAYLLKSKGELGHSVDETLETYFYLCSYETDITTAVHLPTVLANGGKAPDGTRVISERTSNCVVSIMATCGLYDESGMHLVRTGLPAKSGVSGLIVAVATGRAGIAAYSPRLNPKGGSIRGHHIIAELSRTFDWHFAAPWGLMRLELPDNL